MLAASTASALPCAQHLRHVLQLARAAAGDDGHTHRFADPPGDHEIITRLGAVGVDGVQHDLARAEFAGALGPFHGIQAGGLAAAVGENLPAIRRDFLRVNRDHDALAAELLRAGADESADSRARSS